MAKQKEEAAFKVETDPGSYYTITLPTDWRERVSYLRVLGGLFQIRLPDSTSRVPIINFDEMELTTGPADGDTAKGAKTLSLDQVIAAVTERLPMPNIALGASGYELGVDKNGLIISCQRVSWEQYDAVLAEVERTERGTVRLEYKVKMDPTKMYSLGNTTESPIAVKLMNTIYRTSFNADRPMVMLVTGTFDNYSYGDAEDDKVKEALPLSVTDFVQAYDERKRPVQTVTVGQDGYKLSVTKEGLRVGGLSAPIDWATYDQIVARVAEFRK